MMIYEMEIFYHMKSTGVGLEWMGRRLSILKFSVILLMVVHQASVYLMSSIKLNLDGPTF